MDTLTRAETIRILRAMGGDLPADTKLPDDVLEKRLREAVNASQNKTAFPPLDIGALPKWPMATAGELDTRARSLFSSVQRSNIDEAQQRMLGHGGANRIEGEAATPSAGLSASPNPFIAVRATVAAVARLLDDGGTWCVVEDENESNSIGIRIVSVLEIYEDTPAIVVLYRPFNRVSANDCRQWVLEQSTSNAPALGDGLIHIKTSSLELKLLLLYLKLNASLVHADYPIDKKPNEARFKPSVILPIAPLDFDALAKIVHNLGCSVCGKRGASRCARCQTVWYCGPECQRADWPDHKLSCKSLKGGRWVPITFQTSFPGVDSTKSRYMTNINKFSSDLSGRSTMTRELKDTDPAPPDVWGDKVFMIKFQVPATFGEPDHIMIYDRKRSFRVFVLRKNNPAFGDFYAEMLSPRGGFQGLKMYRWAKRTGEWELSVCLDRQPQTDTQW